MTSRAGPTAPIRRRAGPPVAHAESGSFGVVIAAAFGCSLFADDGSSARFLSRMQREKSKT